MYIRINNRIVRLTKKTAIRWHQKMWNWIADQYSKGCAEDHSYLKNEFVKRNKIYDLQLKCFCCTYTSDNENNIHCECCPVKWYEGEDINERWRCEKKRSPYEKLYMTENPIEKEKYAREIANLEVR